MHLALRVCVQPIIEIIEFKFRKNLLYYEIVFSAFRDYRILKSFLTQMQSIKIYLIWYIHHYLSHAIQRNFSLYIFLGQDKTLWHVVRRETKKTVNPWNKNTVEPPMVETLGLSVKLENGHGGAQGSIWADGSAQAPLGRNSDAIGDVFQPV